MRGWKVPILISLLVTVAFVWYLVTLPQPAKPPTGTGEQNARVFESVKPVRDVTPENLLKAPQVTTEVLERLPAVEPPPLPPRKPKPKRLQKPEVIAAGILKTDGKTVILAGIKAIPLNKKCGTEAKIEWPCGMFARTDLRRFVRGRPIECDPAEDDGDTIETRCRLAGYDISAWLVMTGWAIPDDDLFLEELAEAKQNKRGMWRISAP